MLSGGVPETPWTRSSVVPLAPLLTYPLISPPTAKATRSTSSCTATDKALQRGASAVVTWAHESLRRSRSCPLQLAGRRPTARGHSGLLGARDHEDHEQHRHDQCPHGRENAGDTSDCRKDEARTWPPRLQQCAGQDQDSAADKAAEPEDEAAVAAAN